MKQKTFFSLIIAASAALFSSCANTAPGTDTASSHPVAKQMVDPSTGEPVKDHYVSPFRPYNPIVAKGFKSGQLAGDPSTITADPKTGKPDKSTLKVFKLP
ncbi:MAG: hypothetical protein ACSHX6_00940 [Akkermansiaceae bacterium]